MLFKVLDRLYACRESDRVVRDEHVYHGGYWPSDVGIIEQKKFKPTLNSDQIVIAFASLDNDLYYYQVSPRPLVDEGSLDKISLPNRNHRNIFYHVPQSYPMINIREGGRFASSMLGWKNDLVIGQVAALEMHGPLGDERKILHSDAAMAHDNARDVLRQHRDYNMGLHARRVPEEHVAEVEERCRKVLTQWRCPKEYLREGLDTLAWQLSERCSISHIVAYNDNLVYAMYNRLYVIGHEEPVWEFHDPITGLVVIEGKLLGRLKGMASVRRGRKRASFSLPLSFKKVA